MQDEIKRNNSIYSPRFCDDRHKRIDKEIDDLWSHNKTQDERVNGIYTRMNVLLGSFAIACLLLVANLIIK